jgi:hypothetical protein
MNPGGSVKDRTALGIITDGEAKGLSFVETFFKLGRLEWDEA